MTATLLLVLAVMVGQDQRAEFYADFSAARTLYATAAYEDALDRLTRIRDAGDLTEEVETYKALCLLALGRTRESEQVLERLLKRNPQFVPGEETSPRLTSLYRNARGRILPPVARTMYATARASYQDRKFNQAVTQLRDLLAMLRPDESDAALAELKAQAQEFLKVAEAEAAKPFDSRLPAEPVETPPAPPVPPGRGPVYSRNDRAVAAPVEVTRPVPIWYAPPTMQPALYQGLIEVVIDEAGRVESATMLRSIAPAFDAEVVAATSLWRFQAATLDGAPVKFRRTYEIIGHSR